MNEIRFTVDSFIKKLKNLFLDNSRLIAIVAGITGFSFILLLFSLPDRNVLFGSKKWFLAVGMLLILTLVICGILYMAKKKKWKIEKIFLVCGIIVGVGYCVFLPVGAVPDEPAHFWRAYELATGQGLIKAQDQYYEPKNIRELAGGFDHAGGYKEELSHIGEGANSEYDIFTGHGAQTYAIFNYVPSIVGVWIGNIFQIPVIPTFILCRLINMICCVLILYLCIKYIPMLKKMLFLIAFLPMTMQLISSVSADGSIICAGISLITFVLYARRTMKRKINVKDFFLLLLICLVLTITKPVYAPLCLLLFWIPNDKFKSIKHKIGFIILLGIITVAVLLLKMVLFPNSSSRYGTEDQQILFLIQNPIRFLGYYFKTAVLNPQPYINGVIGSSLEWYTVPLYIPYIITIFIIFILLCSERETRISWRFRIFMLLVFCAVVLLTYASMFIVWTAPGADIIEGVQGRYFLPVLLLIPLMCLPSKKKQRRSVIQPSCLYIFMALLNVYALISIFISHV